MKIFELSEVDRPREKLLAKGSDALGDSELLAIILRSGTREESALTLAQKLLKSADGRLSVLSGMSIDSMSRIKGIGQCKAAQIAAALELGRRFMKESGASDKRPITCSRMVYDLLIPDLKGLDHEETWIILVNRQNHPITKTRLSSGGIDSTLIDIRQVLKYALERNALGVFLAHNHPSGNPSPSQADCQQTDKLRKALNTVNLILIDHVIISDNSFYSFADERVISK